MPTSSDYHADFIDKEEPFIKPKTDGGLLEGVSSVERLTLTDVSRQPHIITIMSTIGTDVIIHLKRDKSGSINFR